MASLKDLIVLGPARFLDKIYGNLEGNATSANKLSTARSISLAGKVTGSTTFDGSGNVSITTSLAKNYAGSSTDGGIANTALKLVNSSGTAYSIGSANKPVYFSNGIPVEANTIENAKSAEYLSPGAKINGTTFTGTGDITTTSWGTARTVTISDNSGTNTQANTGINGSVNFTLKLPATIKANLTGKATSAGTADSATTATTAGSCTGNAATATQLATARIINGTSFDGSADITTANWGTARTLTIGNKGQSVNGSTNVSWSLKDIGAVQQVSYSSAIDANTLYDTGFYNITGGALTNGPTTYGYGQLITMAYRKPVGNTTPDHAGQIYLHGGSGYATVGVLCYRASTASAWLSWQMVAHGTAGTGIGSSTTPVYMASNGAITACSNSLAVNITGNATTATTLQAARAINGTNFDGSGAITTANWGTARNIYIADHDSSHTGAAVSVNGGANVTLKLPSTITATLNGSALKLAMHTATTANTPGLYVISASGATVGNTADYSADTPSGYSTSVQYGTILRLKYNNNSVYYTDIYSDTNNNALLYKTISNGTSRGWVRILDSSNYTSYTVTKTGSGASGTWGISISGNAATATKLATARALTIGNTGKNFDGSGNVSWSLDEIGAIRSWSTVITCATWSRLCYVAAATSTIGSKFLLSIGATRNNVVYSDLFAITVHHPAGRGSIVKLSGNKYSTEYQIRILNDTSGNCYVELYDTINNATNSTTMTVNCRIIPIYAGALTKYTSFTSGATLPTNFSVAQTMTVIKEADIQGTIEATTLSEVLPIDMGGTGASTAPVALANLGGVGYTVVTNLNDLL